MSLAHGDNWNAITKTRRCSRNGWGYAIIFIIFKSSFVSTFSKLITIVKQYSSSLGTFFSHNNLRLGYIIDEHYTKYTHPYNITTCWSRTIFSRIYSLKSNISFHLIIIHKGQQTAKKRALVVNTQLNLYNTALQHNEFHFNWFYFLPDIIIIL